MKRLALVLIVAGLLCLAQVGQATTLQAGWYAKIQGVNICGYDAGGQLQPLGGGYFYETPPGQYGPFSVTEPSHFNDSRWISVPATITDVHSDQSLVLPLGIVIQMGQPIAYVSIAWATSYDSSAMYLELWRQRYSGPDTLVWDQRLSGIQGNGEHVAVDTVYEGQYYFRLNVVDTVPEPPSYVCLLVGLLPLLRTIKRRR